MREPARDLVRTVGGVDIEDQLRVVRDTWQRLALEDPYWSILAVPGTSGGRWDLDSFFATGRKEIAGVLETAGRIGVAPRTRRALDLGCGAGRLTQALCEHFDECVGVDIAPAMLALANRHNRFPDRCRYIENARADLDRFESGTFDFIVSLIVLQHMDPVVSRTLLLELIRVLSPGGLLVVQIPSSLKEQTGSRLREALPPLGYRAAITVDEPDLTMHPGERIWLNARLRNEGDATWPAQGREDGWYRIRLGNHWLDSTGCLLRLDDGRADLRYDLEPGAETALQLAVQAPEREGEFLLELDVLQEMVTWFAAKGSPTLRIPVRVTEGSPDRRSGAIDRIEMHGIPIGAVKRLVSRAGARLAYVASDPISGPAWDGYRYYVTRQELRI